MSLLCIAVQNAQTMVGLYHADELVAHWRVSTHDRRTADEWGQLIAGLLERDSDLALVDGVSLCSTVPAVLQELRVMVADRFGSAHLVVVGPGVRSGLSVLTDNPREVGTDRIANALGAVEGFGAPCIVVDVGMATTFDVVNAEGHYIGGAIAPGVQISLDALGLRGAQLRQVELTAPRSVIAKNTVEALQSGAVFGFAGQVDGIVGRMLAQLESAVDVRVIVTGALAPTVAGHCSTITEQEPWLTLHGLRVIFQRNPR
jgi:type III pantothenate kinase